MKKILFVTFILFCTVTFALADDDESVDYSEIHIYNMSITQDIKVVVKPVGFVFNGKQIPNPPGDNIRDYRYSPEAVNGFRSQATSI